MWKQGFGYHIDIVMCIDSTGSMKTSLDILKQQAKTFYADFVVAMAENARRLEKLRIKVIDFRDYGNLRAPAMTESRFFEFGEDVNESVEFSAYVDGIRPLYGGDIPENALEAIALAMKSDWTPVEVRKRQIIMLFTDAPALKLSDRANLAGYPTGMPKDFVELEQWWEGEKQECTGSYNPSYGYLFIFAPNFEPWDNMLMWNRCFPMYSKAGEDLKELDLETVVGFLFKSFGKVSKC